VINDLIFGIAFGQSKLESHINCIMKTDWSIVHDTSMTMIFQKMTFRFFLFEELRQKQQQLTCHIRNRK